LRTNAAHLGLLWRMNFSWSEMRPSTGGVGGADTAAILAMSLTGQNAGCRFPGTEVTTAAVRGWRKFSCRDFHCSPSRLKKVNHMSNTTGIPIGPMRKSAITVRTMARRNIPRMPLAFSKASWGASARRRTSSAANLSRSLASDLIAESFSDSCPSVGTISAIFKEMRSMALFFRAAFGARQRWR